jgi:hypothetical protein
MTEYQSHYHPRSHQFPVSLLENDHSICSPCVSSLHSAVLSGTQAPSVKGLDIELLQLATADLVALGDLLILVQH